MNTSFMSGHSALGYRFIEGADVPAGMDEYYIRNEQTLSLLGRGAGSWRALSAAEVRTLECNGNVCPNWGDVYVSDIFDPSLVRNCFFFGLVRLGALENGTLRFHDYVTQTGIRNSRIITCDIGDNCAISDCSYISRYVIGSGVIISCVNEMDTTNHCKFGEGIVKRGEVEDVRVQIDPLNEAGGRGVLPFCDMICADAYLWTIFRDDQQLMAAFRSMTQSGADARRGWYGTIGHGSVIKHCKTIKDVRTGDAAYIKGANKLKNLTIKSSEDEPAQIGEGVELVNGIIGYGCHVFYGCKAVRFVLGNNCKLNYGARLINSILGDNSTVSCCEVLNNLVFPAHEQHHNNSFLIAAMVMGQSNMAAGATIGSNHNSRGNDGEIIAGRGFWPGLSSAIKHNSRFASFCLVAKGMYPAELYIPLPFSLVTTSEDGSRREVMPAYMWMYNMYALVRNSRKYKDRDRRRRAVQVYETEFLAPDTVQEIFDALAFLDRYAGANGTDNEHFYIEAGVLERSKLPVRIIKPEEARAAYRQMLVYYALRTVLEGVEAPAGGSVYEKICGCARAGLEDVSLVWENLGGQLVPAHKAGRLRADIREGRLASWDAIHGEYRRLYGEYARDKVRNALFVLERVYSAAVWADGAVWNGALDELCGVCGYIEQQVFYTKRKDYINSFRNITYRNDAERDAVLGALSDNVCIKQTAGDMAVFREKIARARV
ncbi:MAG: DUF4954 family protein [Spirochaetaceae bacterium]|jgi:NDP-sugar pyrophosphorylase family protein|nr:DUF4954 family protein [Spirochaetaceae bacterium]